MKIGYIPLHGLKRTEKSKGSRMFADSGHDYADMWAAQHDLGAEGDANLAKDADYQACLDVVLKPVGDFCQTGMRFDYQYRNTLYNRLMMLGFILVLRADNKEAELCCGKFMIRTGNVASLCRVCKCPMGLTSCCVGKFRKKSAVEIKKLTLDGEVEKLRAMSQQSYPLAFHGDTLRFGAHNPYGIHSCTPFDTLHSYLLGPLKTQRTCFFAQVGKDSKPAADFEVLATQIGAILARQSDRSLPRMNFSKGLRSPKLEAKEMVGVTLLLVLMLSCEAGKDILHRAKWSHTKFKQVNHYIDWVSMVDETVTFYAFLELKEQRVSYAHRFKGKLPQMMYRMKQVWRRTEGMGHKTTKFHGMLHIGENIEDFGACRGYDTAFNEAHWKITKLLALLTQRIAERFEEQTAKREAELELLELALFEIENDLAMWDYYLRISNLPKTKNNGGGHRR